MSNEPVEAAECLIDLQHKGPDIDTEKFPLKAINRRLGQTLCEACDHGVDMGEMLFVPVGSDGYGYYHPECVLNDKFLLDAFMVRMTPSYVGALPMFDGGDDEEETSNN